MWRRTARDRVFIAFLVLSTVTVLTLDFRTHILDGVAGGAQQMVDTFQSGMRSFIRPFESVVQSIGDLGSLRDENRRLRSENEDLKRQVETFADVQRENANLRSLLQIEADAGVRGVQAHVIGASLSGLERIVTIDKGRNQGIVADRAVLAPEGLVGHVSWAGASSAKVELLTDARSAVGVRIGESGETGLARGTGGRNLELELVSRTALDQEQVKEGDMVLTSGYQGGIYPSGLPVGKVEDVTLAARGTTYTITVRPFVRFSRLDVLSVVVSEQEVIEAPPSPTPGADE